MRNTRSFQLSTLSVAVTSALFTGIPAAQAQVTDPAPQTVREEVIVTATRREESVQDIPINITAVGASQIESQRLENLVDISRRVPGLTVVDQGARSSNITTVRGLNTSSVTAQDGANDGGGTVATYLGDIPIFVDLDLNDLNRVEVLIGPQGTLYGAGTLGGAIRYIPNKPMADEMTVSVRGDVYDLSQSDTLGGDFGATINIPVVEDKLAIRASIDYDDDPGYIDYTRLVREPGVSLAAPDLDDPAAVRRNLRTKEDVNDLETLAGRFAIRYSGDVIDSTLTYYYQDREAGGRNINHQDASGTGQYEAAHRFEEPSEIKNDLLALEFIADLGFGEFTSATGYGEYTQNGQRDQTDLLLALFGFGASYGYENFPSFAAFTREDAKQETFTQEFRLVSTSDSAINWIVGAFYSKFEEDATSREFTPGYMDFLINDNGFPPLSDVSQAFLDMNGPLEYIEVGDEEREELALFGEIGFEFGGFQATFGARWFEYDVEASGGFQTPLINIAFDEPQTAEDLAASVTPTVQVNEADDDDIIYKANLSYRFTDDIMSYFTWSQGYRNGVANSVAECTDEELASQQPLCAKPDEVLVESDTTENFELGLRTQGDNYIFNAAVYYIEWDDIRVDGVTEFGGLPIFVNGSEARSQGIELSSQFQVTDALVVEGTYAYNDAELRETAPGIIEGQFIEGGNIGDNVDGQKGDRLPGTPEHQVFLSTTYTCALDGGSSLDFNWNMTAQSDVLTKVGGRAGGEELDGFALHNVALTWYNDDLSVTLYGDNVFDKYYETGVRRDASYIADVGLFDLRRYYTNVGRPRQVGVRFNYEF